MVNDPTSLRTPNEKLLPLAFPRLAPPTLVSADPQRVRDFAAVHGRIVLKPLDDCSGRGVRIADQEEPRAIERCTATQGGRLIAAQKFLGGVAAGGKRIFLLAGEPVGAVNRVPRGPGRLADIHQGARVEATALTTRERAIIATVKPLLTAGWSRWWTGRDPDLQ